jgi:hypothetical protein
VKFAIIKLINLLTSPNGRSGDLEGDSGATASSTTSAASAGKAQGGSAPASSSGTVASIKHGKSGSIAPSQIRSRGRNTGRLDVLLSESAGRGSILGSDECELVGVCEDGGRDASVFGGASSNGTSGDGGVKLLEERKRDGGNVDALA